MAILHSCKLSGELGAHLSFQALVKAISARGLDKAQGDWRRVSVHTGAGGQPCRAGEDPGPGE